MYIKNGEDKKTRNTVYENCVVDLLGFSFKWFHVPLYKGEEKDLTVCQPVKKVKPKPKTKTLLEK